MNIIGSKSPLINTKGKPSSASRRYNSEVKRNPFKKDCVSFTVLLGKKYNNGEGIQIGSSMPKSTKSKSHTQKLIRPPTELVPDLILKAARQIDEQNAHIPWNKLDMTLQESKKRKYKEKNSSNLKIN